MRQTGRQRGSATYNGGKGAQLCRVQYGSSLHQNVVPHPSHTTVRLYFACYLQAVDRQPVPELVSIIPCAVELGGLISVLHPCR